jgi:hypothetical protein
MHWVRRTQKQHRPGKNRRARDEAEPGGFDQFLIDPLPVAYAGSEL